MALKKRLLGKIYNITNIEVFYVNIELEGLLSFLKEFYMGYILKRYIIFNISYYVKRKFEFIKYKKIRELYKLLFVLSLFISTIGMLSLGLVLGSSFIHNMTELLFYYLLFTFLSIVFLPIYSRTMIMIDPMDKELLYRTKLSNQSLFLLIFITDAIKKSPTYVNIFALGLGISIASHDTFINILKIIASISLFLIISFIVQVLYINLKVKSMKRLFSFQYLILNIVIGFLFSIIGFYVSQFFVNFIAKPFIQFIIQTAHNKTSFSWPKYYSNLKSSLTEIHIHTVHILNTISPHFIFYKFNLIATIELLILSILLGYLVFRQKIGFWYRYDHEFIKSIKPQSLPILFNRKDVLTHIQWNNLFKNIEECQLHKSFFYISYTIWFLFGGSYCLSLYNHHPLVNAFIVIILINNIVRDAFSSGVDFFTKTLRFDAERESIALYRMSNTNFEKLYHAKINVIRELGFKEALLTIIIVLVFFDFDFYLTILSTIVVLINMVFIPHLELLPSYLSPHFNHQHYSEFESFEDQHIINETLFGKIKDGISLSYAFIFLVGFIGNRSYEDILIFLICWSICMLIALFIFILLSKKAITKKWESRDLYL